MTANMVVRLDYDQKCTMCLQHMHSGCIYEDLCKWSIVTPEVIPHMAIWRVLCVCGVMRVIFPVSFPGNSEFIYWEIFD